MKDLPSHPGGLGSNPGCDAICGLSSCSFLSLLSKVPFFGFSVKSSLQVPVRNITLEQMYTSSQELNKFCYKILSCNNSSWSQPYSWTQKKKHFPRVFHRVVKDTNTLQLLLAYYIFGFSCLTRASKTARRQMIWTRDFRSFLLIVPSLCTQTWLGECFYMIRLLRTLETLANGKRALNELRIKKI